MEFEKNKWSERLHFFIEFVELFKLHYPDTHPFKHHIR